MYMYYRVPSLLLFVCQAFRAPRSFTPRSLYNTHIHTHRHRHKFAPRFVVSPPRKVLPTRVMLLWNLSFSLRCFPRVLFRERAEGRESSADPLFLVASSIYICDIYRRKTVCASPAYRAKYFPRHLRLTVLSYFSLAVLLDPFCVSCRECSIYTCFSKFSRDVFIFFVLISWKRLFQKYFLHMYIFFFLSFIFFM